MPRRGAAIHGPPPALTHASRCRSGHIRRSIAGGLDGLAQPPPLSLRPWLGSPVGGVHSDGHELPRNDGACECAQVSAALYVVAIRAPGFVCL